MTVLHPIFRLSIAPDLASGVVFLILNSLREAINVAEQEKKGRLPDFVGDGVAVWVNKDKNDNEYLTVQLFGVRGIRVNCFPYQK